MHKSSVRGIILSIAILVSITFTVIPSYAEEIDVTSIALEETTIIELTNLKNEEINTFRIWVGSDFNFKSFKTEKGWVGEKTPQGVIVFTSSEPIKKGESVKFGVKTDKANSGINWKALDNKNKQIDTGKVLPKELPKIIQDSENSNDGENSFSMPEESIFRIVPEKPNIGSSIRVTGDKFGASEEFDFYINSKKIGSFVTDKDGHFMTTMKIPDEQKADRADFKIKNKEGDEKKISIRIGEVESRIPESENIKLTVQGIPNIVHRGDLLEIFGTGTPNTGITITITAPDGEVIRTRTAEANSKGNWKLEPLIVPLDRPFGKYTGVISDGKQNKSISWTIESDKTIIITPISLKYEPGEIIKFNGTALPNKPIELVVEDPLGTEVISDIIKIDASGIVEFEFPTTQSTSEGTYTLIATQEKNKELIYVGLGQLPTIPVNLEFDKLNYKSGDEAKITLTGKASEIINLLIIDPSDKPKGESQSIQLGPDGRGSVTLDLQGYGVGVYTAVLSKGGDQSEEIFTVGLLTGSGEIDINTTKVSYMTGDPVLVLGETGPNVLLTITMSNPDGKEIKVKETFSDKNGKISEGSFRIPSDGISGTWTIKAASGSNFDTIDFEVHAIETEGMVVSVTEGQDIPGFGKTINIHVIGARQTVNLQIIGENDKVIEELSFPASKSGEIKQPWIIPKDTEPGTYTIKVSDAFNSAETTYDLK